jgi:hypothetical protein
MVRAAATAALADDVRRELARVADRLRVLGPRWSQRDAEPPEAEQVRAVLQRFADLAAAAASPEDGVPAATVPRLAPHALADQLTVLGHEVLRVADVEALRLVHLALVDLRRTL